MELDKELLSKRLTTIGDICKEIGKRYPNFFESYIKSPRRSKKYPPFPEPIAKVGNGKIFIYDREDILKFLEAIDALEKAKVSHENLGLAKKKINDELLSIEGGQIFLGLVSKANNYQELRTAYEYICGQIEFPYIKF